MKKLFKAFKKGQKGFTLIELLVVIAIIAVLAAIIVPNIGSYISRGETAALQSEEALVKNAVAAAMSGAAVSTITPATVSKTADLTVTGPGGTFHVSDYFAGTGGLANLADLQYVWDVSANGTVTKHP
jgi:type IV pilus assembly protein PilA